MNTIIKRTISFSKLYNHSTGNNRNNKDGNKDILQGKTAKFRILKKPNHATEYINNKLKEPNIQSTPFIKNLEQDSQADKPKRKWYQERGKFIDDTHQKTKPFYNKFHQAKKHLE